MELKTYQAQSMSDALAEVKRDLGRDAVIMNTRSFRKGGFLGLGSRKMWEIMAAPNLNVPTKGPNAKSQPKGQYVSNQTTGEIKEEILATAKPLKVEKNDIPAESDSYITSQVSDIRRMVKTLLTKQAGRNADIPAELDWVAKQLARQEVPEDISNELLKKIKSGLNAEELKRTPLVRKRLRELIAQKIPTYSPAGEKETPKTRVIALIGPTGVGKTTTIAKLAAKYKIGEGKKVAMITIDSYRIAAVDQLKTYAEIIDVPLRAVLSPGELHQVIHTMDDMDVILVDTAGRSQNNKSKLSQLRSFVAATGASEVHLVVSANSNKVAAQKTIEKFMPLGANRIIISKLDEAETFGIILSSTSSGLVPISYVTTGQDVPDDMAGADADFLAGLIVGGTLDAN